MRTPNRKEDITMARMKIKDLPKDMRITKEELKALLGNPDLVIIDVRYGRD